MRKTIIAVAIAPMIAGAALLSVVTAFAQQGEYVVCEELASSNHPRAAQILRLIGAFIDPAAPVDVGFACTSATADTVPSDGGMLLLCQNNSFNGAVAIDCKRVPSSQ
jgi:hypothetical protein